MNELLTTGEIPADPATLFAAETALTVDPGKEAQNRKDHIARIRQRINQGRKHDEHARERYADDRRVARGDTQWLVDTNLVQTILEILMAFIYAKDPDISVTVSDSVKQTRAKLHADMTQTLQIVVSRLLRDAHLKKKAKKLVRSAMTVGVGWLSVCMQTRTERDTLIQNEINDLKQQLDNIAAIKASMADAYCPPDGVKESELQANMIALEAKVERQIALGIALDLFPAEDIQVSPECGELENYLDSPWINKRLYKSEEEVKAITGWNDEKLKTANRYFQRPRLPNEADGERGGQVMQWVKAEDSESESVEGFYLIEEFWSKRDGVIYTLVDGISEEWAREPYAPRQSSRFYDVFLLAFHYIDGERHPQSDVFMLKKLQDEYGRTRSNFAEHRKRSIPATIFDASKVNPEEAKKFTNHDIGEYIGLNGIEADDMRKLFAPKSYAQFDPALYNTQPIMTDIEKVSGAQDAMQSGVQVEKTATEAEIQNNGFGARIGTRKDEIEDVFTDVANHVAQLAMQTLDEGFVRRLAGDEAIWPPLTVDEIMYGFNIAVKAGSTGKPNTAAQRSAWSTLLPLIEKIITAVGNFRAQGPQMEWAAKPYVELLRETVNRLDDKFDIDRLLPTPPPVPPAPALDPATGLPAVDPATGQPVPAPPPMQPVLAGIGGGTTPAPAAP